MAISVMLESFIGSQKFQVKRALEKHFRKYLSYKKDSFVILREILDGLIRRETLSRRMRSKAREPSFTTGETECEIFISKFEAQAEAMNVSPSSISSFYTSGEFRDGGYTL